MTLSPPIIIELAPRLERSKPTRQQPESANDGGDFGDARVAACIEDMVDRIVRAPHLLQECEDCVQEAHTRFYQAMRENPGQSPSSCLDECRFFIRDSLKRGKSVDSPKRRWLGHFTDSTDSGTPEQIIPELVSEIDPAQQASINDVLAQIRARLNTRQKTVLILLMEGGGTRGIARRLNISPSAVGKSRLRIRIVAAQIGFSPERRH